MSHIDIHIIQSVPPSNLNRDETGTPKSAVYGGVRRARVSSQAWKRATRRDFGTHLDRSDLGVRTKRALELLVDRVQQLKPELDKAAAIERATATLEAVGLKFKAGRKDEQDALRQTEYLMFYSNRQLDRLAELALTFTGDKPSKKDAAAALDNENSFDIALFGRMVADSADLNVDAACQVAHAISTHAVSTEADYYTAVDDQSPEEETGAGMIGTIEFNSATLYRYATISIPALQANLGDAEATARAVEAFIRSFTLSMPTGKQNSFANGTLPDAVIVMLRDSRPINLVGAFEEPIRSTSGNVEASAQALAEHHREVSESFGGTASHTWVTRISRHTEALAVLGENVSLDELVGAAGEAVRQLPELQ